MHGACTRTIITTTSPDGGESSGDGGRSLILPIEICCLVNVLMKRTLEGYVKYVRGAPTRPTMEGIVSS
jgi:hypothetical protein